MTATLDVVLDGLIFPEGPRWRDGRLYFSDVHAGKVMAVTPAGQSETICEVPGLPSGLGWDVEGRLLIASVVDRLLVRLDDGTLTTVADLTPVTRWTINDMVVDGQGRAYIGDVGFELGAGARPSPGQVVLVDATGVPRVVDDDVMFPNGSVVTPDGATLIVGETFGGRLTAFDIDSDGSLSKRRMWAQLPEGAVPDGSCLDADGCIWTASPTTREVIRLREGGEVIDRISTGDRGAFACMLGGDDGRTLFVCTALTYEPARTRVEQAGRIEAVEVSAARAGWP